MMPFRAMALDESDSFRRILAEVGAPEVLRRVADALALDYFENREAGKQLSRKLRELAVAVDRQPRAGG